MPGGRPDRIVRLFGAIDSAAVQPIIEALLAFAHDGEDPVVLHICSPGGCVSSGLSLIDTMNHIRAPVFCIASGVVASMAAILLAAGEPGYRYALPHARIMLHPSSALAAGRLEGLQSLTRMHGEIDREIEAILVSAMGLSRSRLRRLLRQERFLTTPEAKTLRIIDHIL